MTMEMIEINRSSTKVTRGLILNEALIQALSAELVTEFVDAVHWQ
jgi:hypothetical protein